MLTHKISGSTLPCLRRTIPSALHGAVSLRRLSCLQVFEPNKEALVFNAESTHNSDPADQKKDEDLQMANLDRETGGLNSGWLSYRWKAPWGVVVPLLFVGVIFILVPALCRQAAIGLPAVELCAADVTFVLIFQSLFTLGSLALVRLLTVKHLDNAPTTVQKSFFNYSPSAPFSTPNGWAVWALIGVLLSPLVVLSTAGLLSLVGFVDSGGLHGGRRTIDPVLQMMSLDLRSFVSLFTVAGILAPILEETVFRGFLLTSLTRWMPPFAAIPLSSLFFALAHWSPFDFPVLFSFGCLLGIVYMRSKNLLTPIIVHGAWNSAILMVLFALSASGIDLVELIKTMR